MKLSNALCVLFTLSVIASCNGLSDDRPDFNDFCSSNPVSGVIVSQSDANLSETNGSVTIEGFGGSSPYTYSIRDSIFQTSPVFLGLMADDYTIIVKDDIGCIGNVPVRIIESLDNPPSFQLTILPIIASNCAVSGCHVSGGNTMSAFASHVQISTLAQEIKDRTQARTMPPIGSVQLTNESIRLIALWVEAGAPNN
jgi:hypothetical protein